jgi:membrane protein DedA with SNARE-associated domain
LSQRVKLIRMWFRALVLVHGYAFLFWYVFAVQAGIPLPADPMLLMMGALIGDGRYSFGGALFSVLAAALIGDLLWYELGRRKGRSVLALLCKLTLEPDTCVRKAETDFMKRGPMTLLFSKFVPGMSLIATPLAGAIRMPRERFLLADAGGIALWATAYLLAGMLFRHQINDLIILLGLFGQRAGLVVALLLAGFIAWRFFQRRRFRRQLHINRISPEQAFALMNGETEVTFVDLRTPVDIGGTGLKIKGAEIVRPAELRARAHEIPAAHEIILYCT